MEHDGSFIRKKRHNKKQIVLTIVYIFVIIIVYSLILFVQSKIQGNQGIKVFDYQFFTISSESMEPEISKGDIVVLKKVNFNKLQKGDIITFELNGEIVTHRIQNVYDINSEISYVTKGDNNDVEDPIRIIPEQIIGKKENVIKTFGNIVLFLNNKITLIFILFIIILLFLHIKRETTKSKIRREKKQIEDKKYIEQQNN